MELPLQVVQDLAPDQSSLGAAKKLLNTSKWPMLGVASELNSIWGQCQGSGANPYLTMADVVDHGYKCTCPSRKFPCKHVLALMWIFSESQDSFNESTPPDWLGNGCPVVVAVLPPQLRITSPRWRRISPPPVMKSQCSARSNSPRMPRKSKSGLWRRSKPASKAYAKGWLSLSCGSAINSEPVFPDCLRIYAPGFDALPQGWWMLKRVPWHPESMNYRPCWLDCRLSGNWPG